MLILIVFCSICNFFECFVRILFSFFVIEITKNTVRKFIEFVVDYKKPRNMFLIKVRSEKLRDYIRKMVV